MRAAAAMRAAADASADASADAAADATADATKGDATAVDATTAAAAAAAAAAASTFASTFASTTSFASAVLAAVAIVAAGAARAWSWHRRRPGTAHCRAVPGEHAPALGRFGREGGRVACRRLGGGRRVSGLLHLLLLGGIAALEGAQEAFRADLPVARR